jgi:hypothetical protein
MRKRLILSICLSSLLSFAVLISCSSTKNRTEQRAKERVTQFIRLMSEDRIEEAEKLLTTYLAQSEVKELFLDRYDNWQLKDTSIVIDIVDMFFHAKDNKNKAVLTVVVRNEKLDFTKYADVPVTFERGDWYIGG